MIAAISAAASSRAIVTDSGGVEVRFWGDWHSKGSITAGKQADLVVLAANPLEADPAALEHMEVVETFSRGRPVYARTPE